MIAEDFGAKNERKIKTIAVEFFSELFATSTPSDIKVSLNHLERPIYPEMNESLCKDISPSKIRKKKTVFSIHPEKAPGPNGITTLFYHKYWNSIGPQVIKMVQEFFNSDSFDPQLNETNICLIQKSERPRDMTNFRPISLCNVCYKIISKFYVRDCDSSCLRLSRKLNLPLWQDALYLIIFSYHKKPSML